eukprot:358731-Chlamydomonas_euryale.AAC.8
MSRTSRTRYCRGVIRGEGEGAEGMGEKAPPCSKPMFAAASRVAAGGAAKTAVIGNVDAAV